MFERSHSVVQLRRDPFARMTLLRVIASRPNGRDRGCTWCGSVGPRGLLWRYGWETDGLQGSRRVAFGNPFCSVGCWETYADDGSR